MNIFILAGGFGTRLQSVVQHVPKPMAPICGKPFLDYQIKEIRKYFPDETIYLLTHYMSGIIEEYYKNYSSIKIIKELQALGTGGSIKHAIQTLSLDATQPLLVFNGDTFLKPNLLEMINSSSREITLLAAFQENCARYGSLNIKNDIIIDFKEKSKNCRNSYINAGCYFFKSLTFFNNKESLFSLEYELESYAKIKPLGMHYYKEIFIDIGIPEDYNKMIEYINDNNE